MIKPTQVAVIKKTPNSGLWSLERESGELIESGFYHDSLARAAARRDRSLTHFLNSNGRRIALRTKATLNN